MVETDEYAYAGERHEASRMLVRGLQSELRGDLSRMSGPGPLIIWSALLTLILINASGGRIGPDG